ncbi:hypothetical protein D3C74_189580 [compost metagenome]
MGRVIYVPPEKQEEYILIKDQPKGHAWSGWESGTRLRRVSEWMSGNGCGVRQALFSLAEKPRDEHIVWEDHVKPVNGQMDLFEDLA